MATLTQLCTVLLSAIHNVSTPFNEGTLTWLSLASRVLHFIHYSSVFVIRDAVIRSSQVMAASFLLLSVLL